MALQSRIVNGSLTEIYAGGGNFVTEAYPTNFHTFAPKRNLLDGQSADDYKEVTPAERSTIEAADAKWEEWPQWLIDVFDRDPNGCYNTKTGFGELNGLTDITREQAIAIHAWGNKMSVMGFSATEVKQPLLIRTNLTPINSHERIELNLSSLFRFQRKMEVCRLMHLDVLWSKLVHDANRPWLEGTFAGCYALRKVIGVIDLTYYKSGANIFQGCESLEDVQICGLKANLDVSPCPKLSKETISFLVTNASNTSPITITVHADVYAKLTDESNTDWHALMTSAAAKNITFATT